MLFAFVCIIFIEIKLVMRPLIMKKFSSWVKVGLPPRYV